MSRINFAILIISDRGNNKKRGQIKSNRSASGFSFNRNNDTDFHANTGPYRVTLCSRIIIYTYANGFYVCEFFVPTSLTRFLCVDIIMKIYLCVRDFFFHDTLFFSGEENPIKSVIYSNGIIKIQIGTSLFE